ncbi:ankyrin repeat-containing domain protein [Leptodontidium sp. MPI-SDFR-AT-0119]|nr:ankyrin repeat-containing domain protein [Leptodontidium sp. MPI-SDFR-AT-0119]
MDGDYSQFEDGWLDRPEPTPLYTAASSGDHTELTRLLKISNDMVNEIDSSQCTPIQKALQNHDIASIELLLRHGADPNLRFPRFGACFENESTSVSEAADFGFVDVLSLLIENGGLVPSVVLYCATESGQFECVGKIFAWLVNNSRTEFDDGVARSTAVTWALQSAAAGWRVDIVEFILASVEADKEAVDCAFLEAMIPDYDHDDYPKRNCVRKGPYEEAQEKRIEVVRLLLEAGADVDAQGRLSLWGSSTMKPLHEIARQGNRAREIFDMLLEKDIDVDSLNTEHGDGQTPLFQAVLADDVYFVERLLEKGANVTHVDRSGNTLLHISTFNETPACSAIMSLLLSHGISLGVTNSGGKTALHEASSKGNAEAARLLLSSDPDMINCRTPEGWTALHFAADSSSGGIICQRGIDVAALILAYGADINALTVEGWTVLQRAVTGNRYDTTEFISFLLKNGADITTIDNLGGQVRDSLLHLALDRQYVGRGSMATLRLLLDNGANMEFKDGQGRTALLRAVSQWKGIYAYRAFQGEYVMELLNRGADINVKDNAGRGLEDLVKNRGYTIKWRLGKW